MIRTAQVIPVTVSAKTTWLFIALDDGEGNTGWGEATLQGQEAEVQDIARRLLDDLPALDPNRLPFATLPQAAAASAIRQAHDDLAARRAGVALSRHLGGTRRDAVGVYANINRRTTDRSPEGMAQSARDALAAGHGAIKIAPFDEVQPDQDRATMARAMEPGLARIAAVRDAIGARRLMVDCHWRFDVAGAEAMMDACAPFALHWIECPIAETPETIPALVDLRRRANRNDALLAGMECAILRAGFAPYAAAGAYDVMMPDVKYCGGPREMLAIAADLAEHGVVFSPHNPTGPICHAHSLHVCAALADGDLLEMQFDESPMFASLVKDGLPPLTDGAFDMATLAPGLGLSLEIPETQFGTL
ncbi:enolase C-terminal domain-like protein [Oceaniglobus trochenteri]|uniref:enolase C-terminal domain-like protein n=1 Tax=Oceaniglobus trochenteri TaxID=2763260 RepID=UPI001CFF7616|nr:enolase C-terminal domain-like protein [Oceaniglobus trochenteri]